MIDLLSLAEINALEEDLIIQTIPHENAIGFITDEDFGNEDEGGVMKEIAWKYD